MGSQRVAHDSVTKQQQMCYIKKNLTRKEKKQSKTNPTMHIQLWHNHTENSVKYPKFLIGSIHRRVRGLKNNHF